MVHQLLDLQRSNQDKVTWPLLMYISHVIAYIFLIWNLFWNHLFFYSANNGHYVKGSWALFYFILFQNHAFFPRRQKRLQTNVSPCNVEQKTPKLKWTGISSSLLCSLWCCDAVLLWPQTAVRVQPIVHGRDVCLLWFLLTVCVCTISKALSTFWNGKKKKSGIRRVLGVFLRICSATRRTVCLFHVYSATTQKLVDVCF